MLFVLRQIPRFLFFIKELTFSCLVRFLGSSQAGDTLTWLWRRGQCMVGTQYSHVEPNGALSCFPCPMGGDCSAVAVTAAELVALPGWWAPPHQARRLKFYRCPLAQSCLPGSPAGPPTVCNNASKFADSVLCAECVRGAVRQDEWAGGQCVECPGATKSLLITLGCFCLAVILVALWMVTVQKANEEVAFQIHEGIVADSERDVVQVKTSACCGRALPQPFPIPSLSPFRSSTPRATWFVQNSRSLPISTLCLLPPHGCSGWRCLTW